jgi:hypothetical protein
MLMYYFICHVGLASGDELQYKRTRVIDNETKRMLDPHLRMIWY